MSAPGLEFRPHLPAAPWGMLPPRLRVLFIAGPARAGRWLADALAADSAAEVLLEETQGAAAGVARLRDALFDVVLISHEPGRLDALELLDALRAAGSDDQPILVLGEPSEAEMAAVCFEAGADGYLCLGATSTRAMLWQLARAHERRLLLAENRRLGQDQRHRLQQEHDEAARLLQQQRALISDLEKIRDQATIDQASRPSLPRFAEFGGDPGDMPQVLVDRYRELLRAYVIMGSGNLADELQRLVDQVAAHDLSAQQMMRLHLRCLEEVVQGLGSRSARHVMNRADLLALELMLHLAEGYRRRLADVAPDFSRRR